MKRRDCTNRIVTDHGSYPCDQEAVIAIKGRRCCRDCAPIVKRLRRMRARILRQLEKTT